jgi:hypothetical protein
MYYREHTPPHFQRVDRAPRVAAMRVPHVESAEHLGGHRVRLRFDDGVEGELDLSGDLEGEIFQPLRDPAYFARFTVDDTLTWPNGADFAPEFLHARLRRAS